MDLLGNLLLQIWPLVIGLALLEIYFLKKRGKTYEWRDAASSVGDAVLRRTILTITGFNILLYVGRKLDPYKLFDLPTFSDGNLVWWHVLVLFLGVEFFYYWFHRFSHEVRWLWATHAVHHSPNTMSLLTAERLGFTQNLSAGLLTFLPLIWLGFRPEDVLKVVGFNLLYQFWLHTELIGKLGFFEKIFNSPSHHRVHHGSNPRYLDKNYGGVLIIFDKLFGTFQEELAADPVVFGLVKPLRLYNPFKIAVHEWLNIVKDVKEHWKYPRRLLGYLFGPPGYSHDGSRLTSKELRERSGIDDGSSIFQKG